MKWARLPFFQTPEEIPLLPSGWEVSRIEDVYDAVPKGRLYAQKECVEGGAVPVLDQSEAGIIGYHNDPPGVAASPEAPVVTFANHTCEMRWVQFSFSVIQNVFPMVGKPGVCDTRFLYYATKGRVWLEEYKGHYPDYRRAWIPVPPLDEQRRIAGVLGSLDDKIELNRKMNRTLEEMAQAIFKSWFIDFDGVPPDDLVDSELGPIPRGWTVGSLGEVGFEGRRTAEPDDLEESTPYIGLADMPRGSIALSDWATADEATSLKLLFERGDLLFGKLRPYFKKVGIAPCEGICSSDILVLKPTRPEFYSYLLGVLTLDPLIDFTEAVSTGTRMPRVSWKTMSRFELALPTIDVAARFHQVAEPMWARILENVHQSRVLADLRDTLLPKLISGEIRVPEAEEQVEAAS